MMSIFAGRTPRVFAPKYAMGSIQKHTKLIRNNIGVAHIRQPQGSPRGFRAHPSLLLQKKANPIVCRVANNNAKSSSSTPLSPSFISKPLTVPGLPTWTLLAGGVMAVVSFVTAKDLGAVLPLPPEIAQADAFDSVDILDDPENEGIVHYKYPINRLYADPFDITFLSCMIAMGYKLEPVNRRGKVFWTSRFGSPMASICITVATVLAMSTMDQLFKCSDGFCRDRLGVVFHSNLASSSSYSYELKWFQRVGSISEELTPLGRELFLQEKWYRFGREVIFEPLVGCVIFGHQIFRYLMVVTNPVAAIGLTGTFCGLAVCVGQENGDVVCVPLLEGLLAMLSAAAYFATGRFSAILAAEIVSSFLDGCKERPETLPFKLSVRSARNTNAPAE